jgi:hypothetical protein
MSGTYSTQMRNPMEKKEVGQPEGKSPFGIPRSRWEDNIRMVLKERGLVCTGFIWLGIVTCGAKDSCEHGNEPYGSKKARNFLATIFSRTLVKRVIACSDCHLESW